MLMIRTFAISPFTDSRREMDRLLDSLTGGTRLGFPAQARPFPAFNLWEDGESVYAEAEVPGFTMDDLEVSLVGNELTVKGQRESVIGDEAVYHRRERCTCEFTRFLTLPVEVDPDQVEARLKDGVLTVTMPKAKAARTRRITVKGT